MIYLFSEDFINVLSSRNYRLHQGEVCKYSVILSSDSPRVLGVQRLLLFFPMNEWMNSEVMGWDGWGLESLDACPTDTGDMAWGGGTQVRDQGHLPLGSIRSAQDKVPLRAGEVRQQSRELEDFTILVGLAVGCGGLTDGLLFGALFLVSGCFTVFGNFSKLGKTIAWLHLLCSWVRTQPELLRKVEKRGAGLGVSAQTVLYSAGQRKCFKRCFKKDSDPGAAEKRVP